MRGDAPGYDRPATPLRELSYGNGGPARMGQLPGVAHPRALRALPRSESVLAVGQYRAGA